MPTYKDLFPDRWLKAEVINGHRPRVTIEHVAIEQLFNPRSKKHEAKLVVKFHKKDLRLICNKTQATALATICKTDDYTRWSGYEVVLSTGKAPNGADTILISPVPDAPPPPKPAAHVEEPAGLDDLDDVTDYEQDGDVLFMPTIHARSAPMADAANGHAKSPDDATIAQVKRCNQLGVRFYGTEGWNEQAPKVAHETSKGAVKRVEDLKVVEIEVVMRELERMIAHRAAQLQATAK